MVRIAVALGRGPDTRATLSTAIHAAAMYHAGEVDNVAVSGLWSVFRPNPLGNGTNEVASMFHHLVNNAGVPEPKIIVDNWARDTFSNMVGTYRALRRRRITEAELHIITIPHAKRRAKLAARMVFTGTDFTLGGFYVSGYQFNDDGDDEAAVIRQERRAYWGCRIGLIGVRAGDLKALQRRLERIHPGFRTSKVINPIRLVP